MSKCDLRIEFDRTDRQYRPGEKVTGTVHVGVNRDVQCNGLVIEHFWQTHGRGNTDRGPVESQVVFKGQWQAGQSFSYPFSFTAPAGPPTYRGHYLNIDHYVKARVDIPWALDPKKQEEYLLHSGSEPYGNRPDVRLQRRRAGGSGISSLGVGAGIVLLVLGVVLCFPFGIVLIPAGCVVLFFALRKTMAEKKIGQVDLDLGNLDVAPGSNIPLRLSFTPAGSARVNAITAKLTGVEECVSGSGTNKTTHRYNLHNRTIALSGERSVSADQPVRLQCDVPIPKTNAYSFSAGDNDLIWQLEVRIDIPMWPDWVERRVLTVRPTGESQPVEATVVDERPPVTADVVVEEDPFADLAETPIEEPADWQEEDVFETVAEPEPAMDDLEPIEPPLTTGEPIEPFSTTSERIGTPAELVEIAESILASSRFGFDRERIVEENLERAFACTIDVSEVDRTYSYAADERFRGGRTVIGRIAGTECAVSMLTPQSRNEEIDALELPATVEAQGVLLKWNTIYDRLEMRQT